MSGTSGRRGSNSLKSAALQLFLENKLRQRNFGSTQYVLTWKEKTTPSGRQYCQLQASALRINAIESGSLPVTPWPTPRASPNENRDTRPHPSMIAGKHGWGLTAAVLDAASGLPHRRWATPRANCSTGKGAGPKLQGGVNLQTQVGGPLNPVWVAWLMGYPEEWVSCAD